MDDLRAIALADALTLHDQIEHDFELTPGVDRAVTYAQAQQAVLNTAETFLAWLRGPVRLDITITVPAGAKTQGDTMQLHDNEQADVTVTPVDAKGFESSDALTYAVGDATVCTVVGADDADSHTATIVAGVPGSTTVTVTDPTAIDPATGNPLFATIAVDVVPAGAVTLTVTEGAPVPQP